MREFKRRLNRLLQLAIVAFAIVATIVGCIDVNTDIGGNFTSNKQEMIVGNVNFDGLSNIDGTPIFTTRHYKSDSINVANQGSLLMGAQNDTYFGRRNSGFFSQITPVYELDRYGFGEDPILDSVIIFMGVSDYAGDTTTVVKYDVYEVIDHSFLGEFNPEDEDDLEDYHLEFSNDGAIELFETPGVLGEVMFSFYFPDQDGIYNNRNVYLNSTYIKLQEMTAAGEDYMQRLMLQDDDGASYELYDFEEEWEGFYDYYKGLYIAPSEVQPDLNTSADYSGATYKLTQASSGLGFYARTRHEDDYEFIKDTVGMDYTFYDSYFGVGVNTVNVTFHDSVLAEDQIRTDAKATTDVEPSTMILAEGMGGIVSEITVEQSLFKELAQIVAAGNPDDATDNREYSDIFFNSAILSLYVLDAERDSDGEYQLYTMEFDGEVDLDEIPSRLGLYYSYSTFLDEDDEYMMMETATDYNYYSEYNYSTVSGFDGYINRSQGCYVMNIPLHLQTLWSEYQDALEEYGVEEFTDDEWYAFEWNKMYVAPEAANLFTPHYAVVQGMNDGNGTNAAPMRLQIIYTLLK
ncbi:MAG: DUF4270 family protein [Rikenellaceae bacterium]